MVLPHLHVSLLLVGQSSKRSFRFKLTAKFSLRILCCGSERFMVIRASDRPGLRMSGVIEANSGDEMERRWALRRLAAMVLMISWHLLLDV